jgi:hypothetical protein
MAGGFTDITLTRSNSYLSTRCQIDRSPRPKKAKVRYIVKSIDFLNDGVVHKEFVPPEQTISGNFCDVLGRLREFLGPAP